jgi:dTDP-glucose pyrophosphorylase
MLNNNDVATKLQDKLQLMQQLIHEFENTNNNAHKPLYLVKDPNRYPVNYFLVNKTTGQLLVAGKPARIKSFLNLRNLSLEEHVQASDNTLKTFNYVRE